MQQYEGTYVAIGPPGCGKTTFLSRQVREIMERLRSFCLGGQSPVLVCSLTKTAAEEVAGRDLPVPADAVATLHAHGYRSMNQPDVIEPKHIREEWNKMHPGFAVSPGLMMDEGMEMREADQPGDEPFMLMTLHRHRLDLDKADANTRLFTKYWETWKEETGRIDFTDMIEHADWAKVPFNARVILVDEAQDLSKLEHQLIAAWGEVAGATILVGDPYQALYTWRAADPSVLLKTKGSEKFKVLSQSYRVPQKVHDAATMWLQNISDYEPIAYHPRKDNAGQTVPGWIDRVDATYSFPGVAVEWGWELAKQGKSVMFLASCNYMTSPIVNCLREHGIPFHNPWRQREGRWNPLGLRKGITMAQRLCALLRPARPVHGSQRTWYTYDEVHRWVDACKVKGLLHRGAKDEIKSMANAEPDARAASANLVGWFDTTHADGWPWLWDYLDQTDRGAQRPIGELFDWYRRHLPEDKHAVLDYPCKVIETHGVGALTDTPRITVGTIHSVKGGESDVVFLFPDLSAAGYADYVSQGGEGYDSVIRTMYVGMTRAREGLILCGASSRQAVMF